MFVIVGLKTKKEAGILPLASIKKNLEGQVKIEKKAEMLTEKVNKVLASTKDLSQIAAQLNTQVDSATSVAYSANGIGARGWEPEILGSMFTMKPQQLSGALKGKSGIFVVQVDQIMNPQPIEDYSSVKRGYVSTAAQKSYNIFKVIKEKSNIKDNRILFF